MADDAENKEQEEGAGAGGGKKKLIIMIVLGIVLIGLSVGGTLFALKMTGSDQISTEEGLEGSEGEAEEVHKPAIYYPLKPTIIVNFNARGKQRFLQADISLMVRDDTVVSAIEEHSTMLQHGLLMLFSGQDYGELQTAEGKELLRQMALAEVQKLLEQEIGQTGVEQVLFTSFVMQ
jgi:flagellar FliL protein